MEDDLTKLKGFKMSDETDKLKKNVNIFGIVNIIILIVGILAAIYAIIFLKEISEAKLIAINSIFMSSLEIIVICIILKMFSYYINDDNASQNIFFKCKDVIVEGKYDREIKARYHSSKVYRSFNILLITHIVLVIFDIIISISISDYNNWVILTTSILNILGSLLELFLLINISKFLTLKEKVSKKCASILATINNMKNDYYLSDSDMDEFVPDLLSRMSKVMCTLLAILYISLITIFITSTAIKMVEVPILSIVSILIGGALDIYLIYFLKSYFIYQKKFILAIKAAIRILREDKRSYLEGFNNLFK